MDLERNEKMRDRKKKSGQKRENERQKEEIGKKRENERQKNIGKKRGNERQKEENKYTKEKYKQFKSKNQTNPKDILKKTDTYTKPNKFTNPNIQGTAEREHSKEQTIR